MQWTGHCICEVDLEKGADRWVVARARVNRDPAHHGETDDASEAMVLRGLIDAFLLRKPRMQER